MKQKYLVQRGYNPDFPKESIFWCYDSEDPIPDWLIDRAEIKRVGDNGEIILETRSQTSGGIEILESGRRNTLVTLKTPDSYILFSETHPIMALTPHQIDLLYDVYLRE